MRRFGLAAANEPSLRRLACLVLLATVAWTSAVRAQGRGPVPGLAYDLALTTFHAGDYKGALGAFRNAASSGVLIGNTRWIDGVCYHTMTAECYFHLGQLDLARREHEKALAIFLAQPGFLKRVQFPPAIAPSNSTVRATIAWAPGRMTRLGDFPESLLSSEGSLNQRSAFEIGGVVDPAHFRRLDVVEVVRCLAVSLRRRNELLGPACRYSKLTTRLTGALSAQLVPSRHWSKAWTDVLLGLALIGAGDKDEGVTHLTSGTLVGNFDHPLTGNALLELGKIALQSGRYEQAGGLLLQATLAGAEFGQADLVEEAFRYMTDSHLAGKQPAIFPAIDRAIVWAQRYDYQRLQASLLLSACEIAVYAGHPQAAAYLQQATRAMSRRDMSTGDIGGRFSYLAALVAFQSGNVRAGNESMIAAMKYMGRGSRRLYQLRMVDTLHMKGGDAVSPRVAELLYRKTLREPEDVDWAIEPMETIAFLLAPHTAEIEHWFEVLLDRRDYAGALAVAEQLRRHRFYSSLPMGGRVLSLRWLTEGPEAMLGKAGAIQGASLRDKYPRLAKWSRETQGLQDELRNLPIVPEEEEQLKQQRAGVAQLAAISLKHESLIREIALRRDPSKLVFPPQASLQPIQSAMRDDEAILSFVTTERRWHAFLIRKTDFLNWTIKSPRTVRTQLAGLLRAMGNVDRNASLDVKDLVDEAWKEPATQLWESLIGEFPSNIWDTTKELVIVPDGVLWYLPFEVLQVPGADGTESLFSRVRVRYAPVSTLAVGDRQGRRAAMQTAFVAGRLFPREDVDQTRQMFQNLQDAIPGTQAIKSPPRGSSALLSRNWDRLIVWDNIEGIERGPYGWSPAQVDRGKPGSSLADWLELPWGSPDQIVLPGFHTAAEGGARRNATGHEVFLAVCGLMGTGTRTALLSRWPVGGPSTRAIVREFVQELPHESAASAWQRSVELARAGELDPMAEPRVQASTTDDLITAEHPFFWAAYMLVDTGFRPTSEEPKADE